MWLCKTSSNSFIRIKYYYCYCWTFVPVAFEGLWHWLLNNRARVSSTSKCPLFENTFQSEFVSYKFSQLITIRDKLAGFSVVRFILKCIYEQCVVYVCKCFSVETCALQKPVNWKVLPKRHCDLFTNIFQ